MGRTLTAEKKKKKKASRDGGKHPGGLFPTEDATDTDLADRNEHEAPNFFTSGLKHCIPDWAHSQAVQPSGEKKKN